MFEQIKTIAREYAAKYNQLIDEYAKAKAYIESNYIGDMRNSELAEIKAPFNAKVSALREETLVAMNGIFDQLTEQLKEKVTQNLGVEGLTELKQLEGFELSEFEFQAYLDKYAGIYKALRIFEGVAKTSGIPFAYTKDGYMRDRLDALRDLCVNFAEQYAGSNQMKYACELVLHGGIIDSVATEFIGFGTPLLNVEGSTDTEEGE